MAAEKENFMKCYDCSRETTGKYTRCELHRKLSEKWGKLWRQANPGKVREGRQRYYQKNRERMKAESREWSRLNKEKKRATQRLWTAKNQPRIWNGRLKKYGLSIEQYNSILALQNNKCAICGTKEHGGRGWKEGKGRFCVDHDHKFLNENNVRGLLCMSCNRGLGYFRDDIIILKNAIKYLEQGRWGK